MTRDRASVRTALAFVGSLASVAAQDLRLDEATLGRVPEDFVLSPPPGQGEFDERLAALARLEREQRSRPRFAPDGAAVAGTLWRDGFPHPFQNDVVGEAYELVHGPDFPAAGGDAVFTVFRRVGDDGGRSWLWRNGKHVSEPEDEIAWAGVSADASTLGCWVQRGATFDSYGTMSGGTFHFRFAGRDRVESRGVGLRPVFSRDGTRCATTWFDDGAWRTLVVDRRRERIGDRPLAVAIELAFDPRGRRVAVTGKLGRGARPTLDDTVLVVGKKTYGERYDAVGTPVFSSDGRRLAYRILRDGHVGIAVDRREWIEPTLGWVGPPVFDAVGARIACTASAQPSAHAATSIYERSVDVAVDGPSFLLVVDRRGKELVRGRPFAAARDPVFAPRGKRIAYAARDDRGWWIVVHGGPRSGPYDEVDVPRWSEDGRHVAFGTREGDRLRWRVLAVD